MKDHTVHHVRLSHVSIAPALAVIPMMIDVAGRFLTSAKPELKKVGVELRAEHAALMTSLDDLGILEPIKAYRAPAKAGTTEPRWVAIDGRHRLEWAEDQDTRDEILVPLMEVSEEEAQAIIEASVIGRRHWTKGQRAWLGVMQHPQVCEATNGTRSTDSIGTAPALATRLGVSADLVSQAAELYRKFYAPGEKDGTAKAITAADLRQRFEPRIWGGFGLGAILAGIAGYIATGNEDGTNPKAQTGFQHLEAPLASLTRLSKYWMAWSAEEREKAQKLIAARIRGNDETPGWPSEFCLAIGEAMAAAGI